MTAQQKLQSRLLDTQTAAQMQKTHQLTDNNGAIRTIDLRDTGNYTIRYVNTNIPDFQSSPFLFRSYVLKPLTNTVDKNYSILGDK